MQSQGRLSYWNDDGGFGFITPLDGGDSVFVHISEFPRRRPPNMNDLVSYTAAWDERGRIRATDVLLPGAAGPTEPLPAARGLGVAVAVAGVYFAVVAGLVVLGRVPLWLLVVDVVLSAALYGLYGSDKAAALAGERRTPENTLQMLAVLGGWPGALMAQRRFRHKTRKASFQRTYWAMVALNCVALAWYASGVAASL